MEKSKKDAAPVSDQTTKTSEVSNSKQLKSLFLCVICMGISMCYIKTPTETPSTECGATNLSCTSTTRKPKLSTVFRYTLPLSSKWRSIGVLLDLDESILEKIEHDYSKCDDRLQRVLSEWMKQSPSWQALAEAIEPFSPSIAEKIKKEI